MSGMASVRTYDVVLELQPEGGYTVYVPDLPGCVSEGETMEEALEMIRDAMTLYLESRHEHGWELPQVEHRRVAVPA